MRAFHRATIGILIAVLGLAGCAQQTAKTPVTATTETATTETATTETVTESSSHSYGIVEVPEGMPAPTIEIEIMPDASSGWNMQIITENFQFAPERSSLEHYPGEGHAHLYIDGTKIARVYGAWYHIDEELSSGDHQVEVTLNSNDHNLYTVKGKVVEAKTIISVEE
jgi:hypothetical protein